VAGAEVGEAALLLGRCLAAGSGVRADPVEAALLLQQVLSLHQEGVAGMGSRRTCALETPGCELDAPAGIPLYLPLSL